MGTSVQPGVAALQNLNLNLIALQIGIIDCGYLQLAACTWLDGFGNINDLIVVKVQSGDCVIAFWLERLFFNTDGFALTFVTLVECQHSVALWVLYVVGKNCSSFQLRIGALKQLGEVVAVKNVVSQYQSAGGASQKLVANDECLHKAIGSWLHRVLDVQALLRAVA